jgi:membrane protease subunit (stomatin/prohibitin family)
MFGFLRKQFIDVIEWQEQSGQVAWRVPFEGQEIQNGAQLTVREGQVASFINEGQVADYFGAGLHTLETANLPMLTSLMHWDKGFNSPFKSDVVFVSMKEQAGLKWGTPQPVTVRDAEFGAIRLRAFGTYSFVVADLKLFVARVLGTTAQVWAGDVEVQLRSAIVTAMASALGASKIPFLDLAANQQAMSETIRAEVDKAFAQWGLSCPAFFVESVSLPDEVQAHLDKGSSMRVLGDVGAYTRFQAAEALDNSGGDGGIAGIGAGIAAAGMLGNAMSGALNTPAQPAEDPFALLEKLHKLLTMGAISQEEFDAKKAEILARVK